MIFVTVGTGEQRFDRLFRAVDRLSADHEIVVQHGLSEVRPARALCFDFMPFADLVAYMTKADAVVTHAGVGSVLTALSVNKKPYVVPRRRRFGEAVDDHQVELARRLDGADLVTLVDDPVDLRRLLASGAAEAHSLPLPDEDTPLTRELRAYLAACCELEPA